MTPPAMGLLDTNVVIDLATVDPDNLPAVPTISAITLAELSLGPHVSSDRTVTRQRQLVLQQAEADFDPLPFDDSCARHFGIVAAAMRASGRKSRARAFDALIAATALAHQVPLYTRNEKDFREIPDLEIVPVN